MKNQSRRDRANSKCTCARYTIFFGKGKTHGRAAAEGLHRSMNLPALNMGLFLKKEANFFVATFRDIFFFPFSAIRHYSTSIPQILPKGISKKQVSTAGRLRWGWVFLERKRILSGIQFTTYFIDFFVVETKRFVGSFVNVILMRQTCGQRSSGAAESKRRALGNHFSERICYMFLISKCKGDRDLGLCTTLVLAFGEPRSNDKIQGKKRVTT